MTEPVEPPRYRYWGSHKPVARTQPVAVAAGKTAQMKIYEPIDSWGAPFGVSAVEFGQALSELGDDIDTIELHMHSPGGEAWEGVAIMNLLRQHPATVNVIVDGLAASAASYIAMAGDTLTMAPNSSLMIHDASGLCYGQAADMQVMLDRLNGISQNIASVYAAKAGGTADDWRAAMQPETWYSADEAVEAGLADRVLPAKDAKTAPTDRFDLSIFAHAGRDHAPKPFMPSSQCRCGSNGTDVSGDPRMEHKNECPARPKTPAEPPVTQPTDPKEADTMSDTLLDGLRKQLGLADDADEATVLAANAEALTEAADPPKATETAPVIPDGKVLVDAAQWDDVRAMAAKGATAHSRQLAEDRDATIAKAIADGKLSKNPENVAKLKADWDADPEMTAKRIADMAVLYPVAATQGYAGHDGQRTEDGRTVDDTNSLVWSDDEANALGALAGLPKGALK